MLAQHHSQHILHNNHFWVDIILLFLYIFYFFKETYTIRFKTLGQAQYSKHMFLCNTCILSIILYNTFFYTFE